MNDGQTDAALEQYKVIVDADPSDAQTYMRIAEIDRRNGKFDQAMEALKKATAVVPDSLEVQYNIAVIDEAQGKYEDAIQILTESAAEDRALRRRILDFRQEQPRRISGAPGNDLSRSQQDQLADRYIPQDARPRRRQRHSRLSADHRDLSRQQAVADGHHTSPMKPQRSSPTTAACRWSPPRNRPTWAIRGRPLST